MELGHQSGQPHDWDWGAFVKSIDESLSAITVFDSGLRARVVEYLAKGSDEEVLLEVARTLRESKRLPLINRDKGYLSVTDPRVGNLLARLVSYPHPPQSYFCRLGNFAAQIPELEPYRQRDRSSLVAWLREVLIFWRAFRFTAIWNVPQGSERVVFYPAPLVRELSGTQLNAWFKVIFDELLEFPGIEALTSIGLGLPEQWRAALKQNASIVEEALAEGKAKERLTALCLLANWGCSPKPWGKQIARFAISKGSRLSAAALAYLRKWNEVGREALQWLQKEGTLREQAEALVLLSHWNDQVSELPSDVPALKLERK